ncbi:uncharacterized protein LOC132729096 [Ruditapes philippinarum]|uniref:uncharacterized protein LOC132729096 n=1 Tax=Ruditapes philippinarum TaxID=129788 RepID=UPI00295B1646|nr:uncharacterized protein LOC132729096 [Ruditapes philippinarum]
MPETKIPLFLRKKADSVLRNESKDKTEKASSSAPNRSCFADKIQELRNLLPDNISDSCGMNSAVLQATIAYIKLLKRKDSNVNRLAKKLEMCNLEVRKLMRRLETLENLYSANPINN